MNILVTGGAGYIGSHFAKAAKLAGHNPIVIDNLSTGHQRFVKFGPFVHADLRETSQVEKCLRDFEVEAVVHFAAKSLVGESVEKPDLYYSNNMGGTLSLLRAMNEAKVKKMVFSSSCATYGLAQREVLDESHPQNPVNPYGRSKLMCETMISDFQNAYGFKYAALRYFNVVGEDPGGEVYEDHNPETHVVPNLLKALNSGKSFELYGTDHPTPDGTAIRDYVDVNDLAQVHLLALKELEKQNTLISNVGGGRGYSVKEVFSAVGEVFGKRPSVIEKPPRAGDPPRLVADPTFFKSWCKMPLKGLSESLNVMKTNLERGRK